MRDRGRVLTSIDPFSDAGEGIAVAVAYISASFRGGHIGAGVSKGEGESKPVFGEG